MFTNTTSHRFLFRSRNERSRRPPFVRSALSAGALSLIGLVTVGTVSAAAAPCPSLGVAAPFAILGGAGVATTGSSSVVGEVASAVPLTTTTSLAPGLLGGLLGTLNGLLGGNDVVENSAAQSAEGAASSAYQSAAADVPTHVFSAGALINVTLSPGVYAWPHSLSVGGRVTLNARGNRHGAFIFQVPGNLATTARAAVVLDNGAEASNVLWQVGGDATLAPSTSLVGTILADHDITLGRGTSLLGRAQ
jgi:Ice-binding-like